MDGSAPVRRIGRSQRSLRGRTVVHGRAVSFESSLERDFLETVDFDDAVVSVFEQPVRLPYRRSNGATGSYVPDFLVKRRSDRCVEGVEGALYEIKYREDLFSNWSNLKPKFKAARKWAKERGFSFAILTENEVRSEYLANIRLLNQHRSLERHEGIEEKLAAELAILGEVSIGDLVSRTWSGEDDRTAAYAYVLRMIAIGRMQLIDLSEPVNAHSRIWIEAGVGFTSSPYSYRANRRRSQ